MTSTMVIAFSTTTSSSSSSPLSSYYFTNPAFSNPRNSISQRIPQLGFAPFSQWNGLKRAGTSISLYSLKIERKGKRKKGKGVYASLFGVGAPEVLVIGVVALLVFGPKGLAEVARNLGKTLREFQPTIRELQEVSREFKSSLEREIGLDDNDNPVPKSSSPNTATKPTSEDNKPENSGINIEPNGSSTENGVDPTDNSLQLRADRFKGALAQLQIQREQEEEKKSEKEKAQNPAESQTPSQETPQALDTSQDNSNSSVTPPSENPDGNALQETASVVVSTDSASKTETQA